jgi:hypothetical protein
MFTERKRGSFFIAADDNSDFQKMPPEQKLISHMIRRALMDLRSVRPQERRRSIDWILHRDPEAPWSFDWCCFAIDADSERLKRLAVKVYLRQ